MPFQRPHSPPMLPRLPDGYLLPEGETMLDVLRRGAELLASEGIQPPIYLQKAPVPFQRPQRRAICTLSAALKPADFQAIQMMGTVGTT